MLLEPMVADLGGKTSYEGTSYCGESLADQAHPVPGIWSHQVSEVREGGEAAKKATEKDQESSDADR